MNARGDGSYHPWGLTAFSAAVAAGLVVAVILWLAGTGDHSSAPEAAVPTAGVQVPQGPASPSSTLPAPSPEFSAAPVTSAAIDLGLLCSSTKNVAEYNISDGCSSGSTAIGGQLFAYAMRDFATYTPNTLLQMNTGSCSMLHIRFAFQSPPNAVPTPLTISLKQTHTAERSVTINSGTVGSLDAPLDGGPWLLSGLAPQNYVVVYFAGTATCGTRDGALA